jgi:tetratricopeptide (TPR) repeat protein/tRNA A-37 threonylcarbamoyl transferase component Bud32
MRTGAAAPSPVALSAREGETVSGRFTLEARLGRGGMGAVFRARDRKLDRIVAVKFLLRLSGEAMERFGREAKTIAKFDHPNIVQIHDFIESERGPCLVMQHIEGEDVLHWIEHEGKVGASDALRVALEVCDGLAYAHKKGVVHRDVKPSNVLLSHTGDVKIVDFGIARGMGPSTGEQIGTPGYMAPEQWNGGTVDYRTDIYGVGAMLYHMLTGEDPTKISLEKVPSKFRAVIDRATARRIEDRFDSVREMMEALETREETGLRAATPAPAPPPPPAKHIPAGGEATFFFERGRSKVERGDAKGGVEDLTRALKIDPSMHAALTQRGLARVGLTDFLGAIEDFTAALKIDPGSVEALAGRAWAREKSAAGGAAEKQQRLLAQAKADLEEAARAGGGKPVQEALRRVSELLRKVNAVNAMKHLTRGVGSMSVGDLQGAVRELSMALSFAPDSVEALVHRGAARAKLGEMHKAIEDYTAALKLDPKNAAATAGLQSIQSRRPKQS